MATQKQSSLQSFFAVIPDESLSKRPKIIDDELVLDESELSDNELETE